MGVSTGGRVRCNSQYELCNRFVPPFLVSLHWIYRVLSFVHGILLVFCRNERYLPKSCFSEEFRDCKVIFPLKNFDVFLSCRRWLYFRLYCVGKCCSNFNFQYQRFFYELFENICICTRHYQSFLFSFRMRICIDFIFI